MYFGLLLILFGGGGGGQIVLALQNFNQSTNAVRLNRILFEMDVSLNTNSIQRMQFHQSLRMTNVTTFRKNSVIFGGIVGAHWYGSLLNCSWCMYDHPCRRRQLPTCTRITLS